MALMVVQRFTAIGEAEAAATALYAFGLDVCLADDEMVALYWTWSNGLGGVKVMVWWEDLELAGVLLGVISESDVPPDVLANAAEASEGIHAADPRFGAHRLATLAVARETAVRGLRSEDVTAPEGDPDYTFGLAILKSAIALSEANASPSASSEPCAARRSRGAVHRVTRDNRSSMRDGVEPRRVCRCC